MVPTEYYIDEAAGLTEMHGCFLRLVIQSAYYNQQCCAFHATDLLLKENELKLYFLSGNWDFDGLGST